MMLTFPLHKLARTNPSDVATIYRDRTRSFGELKDRVSRLAGAFRRAGLKVGGRVCVMALNSDNYLEVILATLWAGGVAVPINARWTPEEFGAAVKDTGADLVVLDENFFGFRDYFTENAFPEVKQVLAMDTREVESGQYETWIAEGQPIEDAGRKDYDLAILVYTGGTTGTPKGVMLSHRNLMTAGLSQSAADCGTKGQVYLHAAPLFHMADIQLMVNHFLNGGSHCFIPKYEPGEVLRMIERHYVSDVLLVPTMIQGVLNHPNLNNTDLSCLRTVFYGAAPMTPTLLQKAMTALPGCDFVQGYGMSETCLATMLPADCHVKEGVSEDAARRMSSAGRELPLTELRIVNGQGDELASEAIGEIQVRGPSITQGYWNMPEKTEELFRDGWLCTGDLGYRDKDGFVYIVDRLKDMIITGGENVYCAEVENVLIKHESIEQCAIIGIADEKWGESVHAAIVLKPGMEVEESDVIEFCRGYLSSYKCPRGVTFLDALPVSPAGKVLKTEIRNSIANSDF